MVHRRLRSRSTDVLAVAVYAPDDRRVKGRSWVFKKGVVICVASDAALSRNALHCQVAGTTLTLEERMST